MEHTDVAQIAVLVGALGAVLVLVPRGGAFPLLGLGLLGGAMLGLAWSLVGSDDLRLLVSEPTGATLLGSATALALVGATLLVRYPAVTPVVLLAAAPFRVPVELGSEEAFLLLPLYLVIAASALALAYRIIRVERPAPPPLLLSLPLATFVTLTATSFLWTFDERAGAIALAFRLPVRRRARRRRTCAGRRLAARALLVTLVALGTLFAAIGIWQAQTRTLFFARDLEVANTYTSFFRVTSLFKDPSLYGRYSSSPSQCSSWRSSSDEGARSTGSQPRLSSRSSSGACSTRTRSRASSRSSP